MPGRELELAVPVPGHNNAVEQPVRLQVGDMISDLLAQVAMTGEVRDDIPRDELASHCLHALSAAGACHPRPRSADSTVTLAGLRPQS
jgi:hypothetical protein